AAERLTRQVNGLTQQVDGLSKQLEGLTGLVSKLTKEREHRLLKALDRAGSVETDREALSVDGTKRPSVIKKGKCYHFPFIGGNYR
ncbi:hypothetical protein CJ430_30320, partial [Klebsiella pneumoniae]